jgi:hypothetical protein
MTYSPHGPTTPTWPGPPHYGGFTITLKTHHIRYDSSGRVISRCRDLYMATRNIQETDIHAPAGFEPAIPASERPQTHALDRAATAIGKNDK